MRVKMRGVRRDHHWTHAGLDPHRLQAFGVTADAVNGDTRCNHIVAVVEFDAASKHFAHHRHHIIRFERMPDLVVTHGAPGRVFHLPILEMVAGARKQVVVAAVVVMQVADDDGLDRCRIDTDRLEAIRHRFHSLPSAPCADRLVEAGINQNGSRLANDCPDKIVERHRNVVRIAADKVVRRLARVMPVADGVDFIRIGHGSYFDRTSTPVLRSSGCTIVVKSASAPISSQACCNRRITASATCIGTPRLLASDRHSFTSLIISPLVKPRSNVRGRMILGNLCSVAVLRPVPALITSSMTRGSSPAFTPITIASAVAAIAVAERKLLASFMVCPSPGCSPMKNTLPNTASAGSTRLTSWRGPDAITASVPLEAPVTPPLTGLSICTMSRSASREKMRLAIADPVVDVSMNRRTRWPSITPPGPVATACTMSGVGKLAITVSTRSANSAGDAAAWAPISVRRATACGRVSLTTS